MNNLRGFSTNKFTLLGNGVRYPVGLPLKVQGLIFWTPLVIFRGTPFLPGLGCETLILNMIDGFRFVWTNIHPRISVKKILCVHNEKGYHVLINLGISRSQDLNRGTNISRPS